MGWFENMAKSIGLKKKSYADLSAEEKKRALIHLKKNQRQTEQKIEDGEKELLDLGKKVIESTKHKAVIYLEQIKQKKMLMNVYTKSFIATGRNANALETCMEFERALGNQFSKFAKQLESLSTNNLLTVMESIRDAVDEQSIEGEELTNKLRELGEGANSDENMDIIQHLEKCQDELIDNEDMSIEEKAKILIERA